MNVTGIYHRKDGVAYLLTERFHSVDPLPATAVDVKLAIDEALNHLDALHKVLASLESSDSIVEQDKLIDAYLAGKKTTAQPSPTPCGHVTPDGISTCMACS